MIMKKLNAISLLIITFSLNNCLAQTPVSIQGIEFVASIQLPDVNVPDALMVATLDLEKRSITDKWIMDNATANFPMALDSKNHRLFIGCRNPAKLLVINSETGKTINQIDISSDTDDVFYDGSSKQIYVSCGEGYIDIVSQIDQDNYKSIARVESRSGARTSLYVPELDQLIIAAPARSGIEAQLMIYQKK